ncbi:hypothetical protein TNCT_637001 [Trichonephila clavata]|uniref:Uncharacterized protein n=1 Tax=Trichonephila clavata TaxID=2740835 RepID=A0A8X6F3L1_TRICU|nr:hypothetical protein TNCT_637001 [Trichonephila clavata]
MFNTKKQQSKHPQITLFPSLPPHNPILVFPTNSCPRSSEFPRSIGECYLIGRCNRCCNAFRTKEAVSIDHMVNCKWNLTCMSMNGFRMSDRFETSLGIFMAKLVGHLIKCYSVNMFSAF